MPETQPQQETKGNPIPCGPTAARSLLLRELPEIKRLLETERWSRESIRIYLEAKYGGVFSMSKGKFRNLLWRVMRTVPMPGQGDFSLPVPPSSQQSGSHYDGNSQPVSFTREGEQSSRQPWEERRSGRFPGSGTNVVHRKKPNRDELY